ncbi:MULTISPECIES: hypothetical protein [unclassified Ochrobactrum]|jgi:hypothetical protein|uniref:hypothetical protein n=1 Tax=unclassified Ochrobactrum TaxID=239106 RepID=UPI0013B44832|nr:MULTISPECIES: hypothetical protein [unclassified Ochrobactrum]MBQ0710091.1 hypothetical protein [Ochrobactrum sp. AP1BH01-1]
MNCQLFGRVTGEWINAVMRSRHGKEHLQIAAEKDKSDQRRDEEQELHPSCIAQSLFTFKKTDGD